MKTRARLLFSEAWQSLGANLSTTVAATMTVLIGMFLLGLFIALGTWTVSWSNHVKNELIVKVYFTSSASLKQETDYARNLQRNPFVKSGSIRYISKVEGLREMEKRFPDLANDLAENPLPDRLDVTPNKGENVDKLYASLTGEHKSLIVSSVADGRNASHRILQVAHVIEGVFVVATAVLLVASILLISNTIRLSIFSRRREIEVMKLVGATNWFIRGPFMLEGLLCGLAGSLLSVFLLILAKALVLPAIVPSLTSDPDVHAMAFPLVALSLIATGLCVGGLGSGLTLRRFLRV